MKSKNKKGGISIIGMLVLGFIIILVLSYYKISVREVVQSPTAQDNIHYVTDNSKTFWDKYLKDPATYLWNDVFIHLFWEPFYYNMQQIRNNGSIDLVNPTPPHGGG